MVDKCSVNRCNSRGYKKYDLYSNRPHFMTMLFCKVHSREAKIALMKRGLKVRPDGTYKKLKKVKG